MTNVKQVRRTVPFYADPGHGWLRVQKSDLQRLGIEDKITPYSYQRSVFAYLEEDRDMQIYLKAAREAGWVVTIRDQKASNRSSTIRSYDRYPIFSVREF